MIIRKILAIGLIAFLPLLSSGRQTKNTFNTDSSLVNEAELVTAPIESAIVTKRLIKKHSSYLLPASMFGFGVMAIHNPTLRGLDLSIREQVLAQSNKVISSKFDNTLQYAPAYAVFALNAVGLKGKNKFFDRLALYAISNTIMSKTVVKLKGEFGKLRPDGSNYRSFPSGHAATAFSAAEFMRLEFKNESSIYGIAAYTMAAATGALRIYRNSHWFSDIVAGAGIGILSTDLTYFAYPKIKKLVANQIGLKPKNLTISPSYQQGKAGLSIVYNPK